MSDRRPPAEDRRLLGDLLVEAGIATRRGVGTGLEEQRLRGGRLGYNLLKLGLAVPGALHLFLKENFESLSPDLALTLRTSPAVDLIPAGLAHFYGMVPVCAADGVLELALATADTPALVPAVEALTGLRVEPIICPPALLSDALFRFYPSEVETGVMYRPGADNDFVLSDRRRRILPSFPADLRGDAPAAERLRSLLAEGIRRGALRLRLEPERDALRVTFSGRRLDDQDLTQPSGAYPGLARLLEGITGIAARPRVVPREGRFLLRADHRRLVASVAAFPGLLGDSLTIDLREEKVQTLPRTQLETDLPDLPRALDHLAAEGRGLLIVAGSDPAEAEAGVALVLDLLGERRPRRAGIGREMGPRPAGAGTPPEDEEEIPFEVLLERAASGSPDLLILADLDRPGRGPAARDQAADRLVVATLVPALDASAAEESLARAGLAPLLRESLAGILAVRLMEPLCASCRRPADPFEALPAGARYVRPPAGSYGVSQGCSSCRGSGLLLWRPVAEFHPRRSGEDPLPAGLTARERRASRGVKTLFSAGLAQAASGLVDVREPLRLLFHER